MSRSIYTALTVTALVASLSFSLIAGSVQAQLSGSDKEPEPTLAPPRTGTLFAAPGTKTPRVAAAPKKNYTGGTPAPVTNSNATNSPATRAAVSAAPRTVAQPAAAQPAAKPSAAALQAAGPVARTASAVPPQVEPVAEQPEPDPQLEPVAEPVRSITPITKSAVAPQVPTGNRVVLSRRAPQLTVEATGPKRVTIGKEQTYTITVNNSGDDVAENVLVTIGLPNWIEIRDANSSDGSAAPASDAGQEGVQWRLERLAGRANQTLSLKLVARKSQPFDLGLQWSCSPVATQALVEVEEPKLQLSITGPAEVNYGQQQSYKLTLSNPGNGAADNVTIFLLPLSPRDGGQVASQNIGTLPAGTTKSLEIELVPRQNGEVIIAAEATADGELKTATQHAVRVRRGELKLTLGAPKSTLAGVPVQFEVRVANHGDAAVRKAQVTAQLPSGAEVISVSQQGQQQAGRGEVTWTLDQVPAGSEQVLFVKCVMKQGGTHRLASSAIAEGDLHAGTEVALNVNAFADLHLEVNDTPGPIALGQTVTYDVKVRNRGTGSAEGIDVFAYFSEGIEPVNVDGAPHEITPGAVTIKSGKSLAPGAEMVYRIRAKAATAGQHKIRVELMCQSIGTKLTQEDTTLFYADESSNSVESTATTQSNSGTLPPR